MIKNHKPTLVVMAAGMGSRYGGLKQIDPITEQGEIIIDFSLYDAMMAGFEDVVFIIKKEIEEDVRARIDGGAGKHLNITYVFQELSDLPPGYTLPEGRVKPWGTCHAVLAAKNAAPGNIAVINADDYYGPQAFRLMYSELEKVEDTLLTAQAAVARTGSPPPIYERRLLHKSDGDRRLLAPASNPLEKAQDTLPTAQSADARTYDYSMVGYKLANTLTEHGDVARGVCVLDEGGRLGGVDERLKIMWRDSVPAANPQAKTRSAAAAASGRTIQYEDESGIWHEVPPDATVSMNFWGFTPSFIKEVEAGFPAFLDKALEEDPLKAEYLLPRKIDELLKAGKATVKVLPTDERWFGVTYKEDKEHVTASVAAMKDKGLYPETLW